MPKRALIERRPWLLASLAVAIAYYLLKDENFPGVYLFLLEAGALLLLAVYAFLRHGDDDGRLMAGMMALAGIGVVAVELNAYAGVLSLIVGSGLAIAVFQKHRRKTISGSQKMTAVALMVLTPTICWLLSAGGQSAMIALVFGIVTGGMAGLAWVSGFPRYRVGIGAVLYVLSTLVSLAGASQMVGDTIPGLTAWPLFYLGHFLICTGVIQTLRSGTLR